MKKGIVLLLIAAMFLSVASPASAGAVKQQPLCKSEAVTLQAAQVNSSEVLATIECGDSGDVALGVVVCFGVLLLIAASAA